MDRLPGAPRCAMARAARLPSATASTTSRPPLTQSPPAKYRGLPVCPVGRSTVTQPSARAAMPRNSRQQRRTAAIARAPESPCRTPVRNRNPAPGAALRRPLSSVRASRVSMNCTHASGPTALLARDISTGCASQWKRTPSTLAWSILEAERRHLRFAAAVDQVDLFGAQALRRVGGVDGSIAAADHHHAAAHARNPAPSCSAR